MPQLSCLHVAAHTWPAVSMGSWTDAPGAWTHSLPARVRNSVGGGGMAEDTHALGLIAACFAAPWTAAALDAIAVDMVDGWCMQRSPLLSYAFLYLTGHLRTLNRTPTTKSFFS